MLVGHNYWFDATTSDYQLGMYYPWYRPCFCTNVEKPQKLGGYLCYSKYCNPFGTLYGQSRVELSLVKALQNENTNCADTSGFFFWKGEEEGGYYLNSTSSFDTPVQISSMTNISFLKLDRLLSIANKDILQL